MSFCADQLQVQAVLQGTGFSIRPRGQRSILHNVQARKGPSSCDPLSPSPVQRGATPLGPPEAPDGEVSAVREGERPP